MAEQFSTIVPPKRLDLGSTASSQTPWIDSLYDRINRGRHGPSPIGSGSGVTAGERPVGRSAPPDRQGASLHEICGSFPRIQSSQPQFAKSLALLPEMPLFFCGVCYNLVRAFEGR